MNRRTPLKIKTLAPAKQRRLDALLDKNAQGKFFTKDREKLQVLVTDAEALMAANAARVAEFTHFDRYWRTTVLLRF